MLVGEQQTTSGKSVSWLKGAIRNLWNIFHATSLNIFGIFSCHVNCLLWSDKIFLVKPKILCHVDKHPTWRHKLIFQSLYLFAQMMLVIYSINMGRFWKMEMLNWVKDSKQMKFDYKCSKRVHNITKSFCRD